MRASSAPGVPSAAQNAARGAAGVFFFWLGGSKRRGEKEEEGVDEEVGEEGGLLLLRVEASTNKGRQTIKSDKKTKKCSLSNHCLPIFRLSA